MKIAAIVLLIAGLALLLASVLYGRKKGIKTVKKEYQMILSGSQITAEKDMSRAKQTAARKAAEKVYSIQNPDKEEKYKLSEEDLESLAKAEEKAAAQKSQHSPDPESEKTSFLQVDSSDPDPAKEYTQLLSEDETSLLEESDSKAWDKKTSLLEEDVTEILLEKE